MDVLLCKERRIRLLRPRAICVTIMIKSIVIVTVWARVESSLYNMDF